MTEHTMPAQETRPQGAPVYHADFEATREEVSRVCSDVHALSLEGGGPEWAARVDLGLTEALTNLVRYGYAAKEHGRVAQVCLEPADQWPLMLKDCGTSIPQALMRQAVGSIFNFNFNFNFDSDDLQSIPEGGMGLAHMGSCFHSFAYQVHQGSNCLMLTEHFDPLTA